MLHSMLEAGSDTVRVLLTRVDPRDLQRWQTMLPLSGALVWVFSGADTVQLAEAPTDLRGCLGSPQFEQEPPFAGAGCYGAIFPGGIRSGQRYGLLARLPGGGEIRGEALVPDSLTILRPAAQERFEVVPAGGPSTGMAQEIEWIPVQWEEGAPGVAGVMLRLHPTTVYRNGARLDDATCVAPGAGWPLLDAMDADSAAFPILYIQCLAGAGTARQPVPWDSLEARLLVTGFDSAYVHYYSTRGERAVEHQHAAVGITGALGVFAGSATTRHPVVLVARP